MKAIRQDEVDEITGLPFELQCFMRVETTINYNLSGAGFGDDYRTSVYIHRCSLFMHNIITETDDSFNIQ